MTNSTTTTHRSRVTRDPGRPFVEPEEITPELLARLAEASSAVLVKKLAKNDRQWAVWNEERAAWSANQAGPLLPEAARVSGFFPRLNRHPDDTGNCSTDVSVFWPRLGKVYPSRFIWYPGKGPAENHFTVHPRSEFGSLSPASLLVLFKPKEQGMYRAVTINAADDDLMDYATSVFGLDSDFRFDVFETARLNLYPERTLMEQFLAELLAAKQRGGPHLSRFVQSVRRAPAAEIGAKAFDQWCRDNGRKDLNPFTIETPGDAIWEITRVREFALYKKEEARYYGAQAVRLLAGDANGSADQLLASLISRFDALYEIFKSAKQARVSRAGGSFEQHMERALQAGKIPFDAQYVFDGNRPDFVMPTGRAYREPEERKHLGLVFPLKTTLRERWRQVASESTGCPIYLATLDETVNSATLEKLKERGISLVVPERFKHSDYLEYQKRAEVLSFKQFFELLRDAYGPKWRSHGVACFEVASGLSGEL